MSKITIDNYEAFLLDYAEGNLSGEDLAELKAFVLAHPELEIDLGDKDLPYFSENEITFEFKHDLKKNEEYLADEQILMYLEGLLSPAQKIAFENTLAADRSLALQLEQYKTTLLKADLNEGLVSKASLLKTEDDLILRDPAISYLEKQMSAAEEKEFELQLAADSSLKKDYELLAKTKLQADASVIYPNKEELKKETKVIVLFTLRRVTAVAAALLLLFGLTVIINYYNNQQVQPTQFAGKNPDGGEGAEKAAATSNQKDPLPSVSGSHNHTERVLAKKEQVKNESENSANGSEKRNETENKAKEESKEIQPENTTQLANNQKQSPAQKTNQDEKTNLSPREIQSNEIQGSELAVISQRTSKPDSALSHSDYIVGLAYESEEDEIAWAMKGDDDKSLWKRAVRLAKQVNKLGVKAVDGQEDSGERYRLSFNSFSVEKK